MIINFFVFLRQEQNIIFSKKRERDIYIEKHIELKKFENLKLIQKSKFLN